MTDYTKLPWYQALTDDQRYLVTDNIETHRRNLAAYGISYLWISTEETNEDSSSQL